MQYMSKGWPQNIHKPSTFTSYNAHRGVSRMGFGFYWANQPTKSTKNQYISIATDYTTKWVEAKTLKDNTTKSTSKFLFEKIITKFGCPLEFVSDQRSHIITDTIKVLTQEFLILQRKSTTYYPQANRQAESTNKVIKIALTKMVNANQIDWDTKLHATLWAHMTA